MGLITVQEYKDYIGNTSTKEDARFSVMIEAASAIVLSYIGRSISADGEEEFVPIIEGRALYMLPDILSPVDTSALSVSYITETGEEVPMVLYTDYSIVKSKYTKYIKILNSSIYSDPSLQVILTWASADTSTESVPEDIKLATLLLTKYYVKDEYNVQQVTSSGTTVDFQSSNDLPPHVKAILDFYREL